MDGFTFAMLTLFGVPAALLALLFLAYRLIPKTIWYSRPVQFVATGWVLGLIAAPFALAWIDMEGEYFDSSEELAAQAFALPAGAAVDYQRDRTVRLGDCWRNAVNWRSQAAFASPGDFDRWYASQPWRDSVVAQVAAYFGVAQDAIRVDEGALELRERDPRYVLSDARDSYHWNTRIFEFDQPFVCAAIEQDVGSGSVALRRCDPLAVPADTGNKGWVIVNPDPGQKRLEGRILYVAGPHYCSNPIRRGVNTALGLPHPEGESNLSIGTVLPSR